MGRLPVLSWRPFIPNIHLASARSVLFWLMEHQGVEYTVVQTINPLGWKWSFGRDGRAPKTGIAFSRAEAVSAAERSIVKSLREEKRQ
jgi:hypothetical protein